MWTSRDGWLSALGQWASSSAFTGAKASSRVSITAATLLAIAAVMTEHADHGTGRHVAVTRARIADRVGCSLDTVTVAWRLLRVAGWAVEAQRGHGSPSTPTGGRRPSVYHLISRREPRPVVHNPDLPPKADVCSLPSVGKYSPSARERAGGSPSKQRRPYRATPRPLQTQRLAAQLVARSHGLHRGHIGAICDAITAAGIDPAVWSARAIADALNADMKARGWSWPDHIERPGAFLASRLRRIEWRPEGPPKNGGYAAGPDTTAAPQRSHEPSPPETSQQRPISTPEGRAAARELFRAAKAARRRATDSQQPAAPPPATATMTNTATAERTTAHHGVSRSGQQQVHQQRAAGAYDLPAQVVAQR